MAVYTISVSNINICLFLLLFCNRNTSVTIPYIDLPEMEKKLWSTPLPRPFFILSPDQSKALRNSNTFPDFQNSAWTLVIAYCAKYLNQVYILENEVNTSQCKNPSRSGMQIFFFRINFVCWLLFGVHSTPVLLQWQVKDSNYSAKSAGGRLHINLRTPLTPQSHKA